MKCPVCGSEFVSELTIDDGSYVLMQTKNKNLLLDSAMPVRTMACIQCKALTLFCDSLKAEVDGKTYTI